MQGLEGENVVLQDIFMFQALAVSESDKVEGQLKPTGIRPNFSLRLDKAGFRLSGDIFGAGSIPMPQGKRK
jgi:pilus assembly protein CpaF